MVCRHMLLCALHSLCVLVVCAAVAQLQAASAGPYNLQSEVLNGFQHFRGTKIFLHVHSICISAHNCSTAEAGHM